MTRLATILTALALFGTIPVGVTQPDGPQQVYVRANQVGYRPTDPKIAIAFSSAPFPAAFVVERVDDRTAVFKGDGSPTSPPTWGAHPHYVALDFSSLAAPGRYQIRVNDTNTSISFEIADDVFKPMAATLVEFLRQQRCGYNPFLDVICHAMDGRTAFGPRPAGSWVDARGGWHDAGDQLKYLITSSTATAHLLLAYTLAPGLFDDRVDANGRDGANGLPDVLDEARWGLDWMLRLHPTAVELYHQVADDRDHIGWKLPHEEKSDYGWGPGGERVVYGATGEPQGLGKFKSESNGMANIAGRYAAAMALAARVWGERADGKAFGATCLQAAREVYALGQAHEGVQQGNSYGAPYRYEERTWADDMEWGAAELYATTRETRYIEAGRRYATLAGTEGWMGKPSARHYEFYPFFNAGHARLAAVAPPATRREVTAYYRAQLDAASRQGAMNPWSIGVPFIWCSNNLTAALASQGALYERITGDRRFRTFTYAQRDWLLGRNPWGVSMFTWLPSHGTFPTDPHLSTTNLTGRKAPGGLVDGPVAEPIFKSLKGVALSRPDPYAAFQSAEAVYHDDIQDYSTNEPTMDGTAQAVLMLAALQAEAKRPKAAPLPAKRP